jgi:hypothetical protein
MDWSMDTSTLSAWESGSVDQHSGGLVSMGMGLVDGSFVLFAVLASHRFDVDVEIRGAVAEALRIAAQSSPYP